MSQSEMKSSSSTSAAVSSPDVINTAAAKLCHIVKRPDFDGYGFNLHSEKAKPGQFIGKVDANSPAEAAGLKEGDRIIEVNGMPINNETHKQVVQRIKAISCEVRLLLIDVEGKGDGAMANGRQSNNTGQTVETSKTEQVMPGASENINSITMVSTKRPSHDSQRMSTQSNSNNNNNNNGLDVTDKAVSDQQQLHLQMNNNNVPPPPSATMASPSLKTMMNNNNTGSGSGTGSNNHLPTSLPATSNGSLTETAAGSATAATGNGSGSGNGSTIRAGSLQLPMTAAEMRAKLMMKKKYDPKNESVDLKKKYEIVQKL